MIIERLVALVGIKPDDASFRNASNKIKGLTGLVGQLAAAFGGIQIAQAFNQFAVEADAMVKHARKINMSVEALQELRFAGERSGIAANAVNTAMQRLQRRTADAAKGMGPAVQAFAELGLNAQTLSRMKTDQILERVVGALQQKPKQDWTRLLTALADIEGTEFAKIVEGGLPALRELRKEANKLGGVFSEEDAKRAEAYQDAMFNIRWALTGIRNVMAADLLPTITNALTKTTEFFTANREGVMFIIKGLTIAATLMALVMTWPLLIKAAVVGALALIVEDIYAFFQGKDSVTGIIVDAFQNAFDAVLKAWDVFKGKLSAKIEAIADAMWDMMPEWMKEVIIAQPEITTTQTQSGTGFTEPTQTSLAQRALEATVPTARGNAMANIWSRVPAPSVTNNKGGTVNYWYGVQPKEVIDEIRKQNRQNNATTTRDLSRGDAY